ncbi:MAG: phosphoribosylformylglycinamidine synthase [Clostridia bacterium]|jgi:phosphoribosylformylglycinamidine synthase|nr:phosphoribosylformylglycinamidine synthase [Clostridia bacterium]
MVKRIYVEKKPEISVEAKGLLKDLKENLLLKNLEDLKIVNRYDVEGINDEIFEKAKNTVFSEPQVDECFEEEYPFAKEDKIFGVEYLPGQFDQRANSLSECLQILTEGERPLAKSAKIYVIKGNINDEELEKIKKYIINPVDSRECTLKKLKTVKDEHPEPKDVAIVEGFIHMTDEDSKKFYDKYGFAMDIEDLKFCQKYFRDVEKRDPSMTEMKMIDTYWSDHCRHTTFLSKLDKVEIDWDLANKIYEDYKKSREYVYDGKKAKDICLMDVATIAVKELKKKGMLKDLDESEEINACSIQAEILVDGKPEEYLIMFKNETHNHPTEIEPFGGAATCLGGAIRDPLSGRVYVYQAMRVTGCGDPRTSVKDTLPNKLPQRKLTNEAARGYSSYGNQIGLATGQVAEIYHPGYVAKRLEIGALVGAAPKKNVIRKVPEPGDVVVLLGGRTGRDGCGGATGSSKAHNSASLTTCGAEVQKGNAPEERKIQRLFRNPEVTTLIKRCNDFGAGGVSVAIGELADGLEINLDKVPKKYEGLDGTELAISESQERMAVVIEEKDVEKFQKLAEKENIESTVVAKVTKEPRMKMYWRGKLIVDLSREFLNTNGTVKIANAKIEKPKGIQEYFEGKRKIQQNKNSVGVAFLGDPQNCIKTNGKNCAKTELWKKTISDLNCCSQKGLVERFDSSIGAGTVLMPFGGKYQLTPTEAMCARIPTLKGYTNSGTIMSFGYDPYLSEISPLHGAVFAVIDSLTKYVACGGDYKKAWFTFQEYFEKLREEPTRWGKPLAALLGAYLVQEKLGLASIGGKDSMSGSYNELDVPPTLTSFCIGVVDTNKVVSNEFKKANSNVYMLKTKITEEFLPDFEDLKENYELVHKLIEDDKAISVATVRQFGIADTITKMCIGNKIGFEFKANKCLFKPRYATFIIEAKDKIENEKLELLGITTNNKEIKISEDEILDLEELIKVWEEPLEKVFPTKTNEINKKIENILYKPAGGTPQVSSHKIKIAKPKIFIPVFPGTNCEYDLAKAFIDAGGDPKIAVFKNLKQTDIEESIIAMEKLINESQIIMLPGGFSAGDEPDGSGKFIATVFRNPRLKEAIHKHLNEQDGLILGICNGFQALIKLGLVPFGEIVEPTSEMPTLTYNNIARHQSKLVTTKVVSKLSPWFSKVSLGEEFVIPISHGEGKFVASEKVMQELITNGQVATQYVDEKGNATYDIDYNPNGSVYAVEGITSKDGRILGKMAHSERSYRGNIINVPGNMDQKLFESGIEYFK